MSEQCMHDGRNGPCERPAGALEHFCRRHMQKKAKRAKRAKKGDQLIECDMWRVEIQPLMATAAYTPQGVALFGSESECRARVESELRPCWVTLINPEGKVEESYAKT